MFQFSNLLKRMYTHFSIINIMVRNEIVDIIINFHVIGD